MEINDRIRVLTEGAKYDVSCSSSGSNTTHKKGSLGNAAIGGICHSFTNDGRCVSLLKILLSNYCVYDCAYCINRRSSGAERARLTPREICELIISFYRRNYIEGLFLSSAVDRSPNYSMEKLTETVMLLRKEYNFRGYIHLKAIPGADSALIDYAAMWVDRMSFNIEFASESSLKLLAPDKSKHSIIEPISMLSELYLMNKEKPPVKKIPAGQTTQMVVGASPDSDARIIRLSQALYRKYAMKRVYYSAYVPVNTSNALLPAIPVDLRREHRLYEADWLLRFYGYRAEELLPDDINLPLDIDPKSNWAVLNYSKYPVEINTADYEMLLRIPGIGVRNAYRIVQARRHHNLDMDSLKKMRVVLKRARHFITVGGKFYGDTDNPDTIRNILTGKELLLNAPSCDFRQISIFDSIESVMTGEL